MDLCLLFVFIQYLILAYICYRSMCANDILHSKVLRLSQDNLELNIKLDEYRNSCLRCNERNYSRVGEVVKNEF